MLSRRYIKVPGGSSAAPECGFDARGSPSRGPLAADWAVVVGGSPGPTSWLCDSRTEDGGCAPHGDGRYKSTEACDRITASLVFDLIIRPLRLETLLPPPLPRGALSVLVSFDSYLLAGSCCDTRNPILVRRSRPVGQRALNSVGDLMGHMEII